MPRPAMTAARLSHLTTWWDQLHAAHHGPADAARAAVGRLVDRYGAAVRRYLRAATRDPDAADEVFQEFALKLTAGAFRGAEPARGRFRDYVRTVLLRLVRGHRHRAAPPPGLPADPPAADEDVFDAAWRAELFDRGWAAVGDAESLTGRPLRAVLRLKIDDPGASSEALAARLTAAGRPATAVRARQYLAESRARFAAAVVAAVAGTLTRPAPAELAAELADLGLLVLPHFRDALTRRAAD